MTTLEKLEKLLRNKSTLALEVSYLDPDDAAETGGYWCAVYSCDEGIPDAEATGPSLEAAIVDLLANMGAL